jgi:hypothetical protein
VYDVKSVKVNFVVAPSIAEAIAVVVAITEAGLNIVDVAIAFTVAVVPVIALVPVVAVTGTIRY